MANITINGVTGTSLLEYQDLVTTGYLNVDENWNVNPETPDGQVIAIWSEQLALLDEMVQYAYMSRDPATATGQALDDIADYAGITRQAATFSTAQVTLSGVDGTNVPIGSRVRNNETGTTWAIEENVTISGDTVTNVRATEPGSLTAAIGTLTEIVDPVGGWQAVTNENAAAQGQDEESDNAFRLRRNQSVALPGSNQLDSIFGAVSNVDGVLRARVYENPTSDDTVTPANPNGFQDHSIAIFVQGGEPAEIRSAIAAKKNPGCGMNAGRGIPNEDTQASTTPLGQVVSSVTFFRPELVSIFVEVTIDTDELSVADQAVIKQAIVDYSLEGLTGQGDGFTRRGFQIGERVSAGRLYTPVNEHVTTQGIVESITVGTSASPTGNVVNIDYNQLGVFDVNDIEIIYV